MINSSTGRQRSSFQEGRCCISWHLSRKPSGRSKPSAVKASSLPLCLPVSGEREKSGPLLCAKIKPPVLFSGGWRTAWGGVQGREKRFPWLAEWSPFSGKCTFPVTITFVSWPKVTLWLNKGFNRSLLLSNPTLNWWSLIAFKLGHSLPGDKMAEPSWLPAPFQWPQTT